MNNVRMKRVKAGLLQLNNLVEEITDISIEEEITLANMSESAQEGERGERAEFSIEKLDDACKYIGYAISFLEEIIEYK